jgi:hypothetical protein
MDIEMIPVVGAYIFEKALQRGRRGSDTRASRPNDCDENLIRS